MCDYILQQQLLQKISNLELDTHENQEKIRSVLEEKAKQVESLTSEVTKRDHKLKELENETSQLKVALHEEKQLHLVSVENEKQLEENNLKVSFLQLQSFFLGLESSYRHLTGLSR
jgi:sugar diacid utilization regulator